MIEIAKEVDSKEIEKQSLIENISMTKNVLIKIGALNSEYGILTRKFLNFKWWMHIIIYFIFMELFTPIGNMIAGNTFLDVMLLIFTIVAYVMIYKKVNKHFTDRKFAKNESRVEQIKIEVNSLLKQLDTSLVPKDYQTVWCTSQLESYLINLRADSLKEAINLLEQEKKHNETLNQLHEMKVIQYATLKEARETNRHLFWD